MRPPSWTIVLAAAAGLATESRGQEVMQVSYTWSEVVAGTLIPAAAPNSVLEPGEGARIGIGIFATINGTNAIGQTTTYASPPPPGFGTVRGIGSAVYNFYGDNGATTAAGSWNDRAISPVLHVGSFLGNLAYGGAVLDSLGGSQYVPPGQTANATNPIADFFRGVWNPVSFQQRVVNFKAGPPTGGGPGQQNGIFLQYGTGYVDPSDPSTAYALYITKYFGTNFGLGVNIPIAPAPPTLAILGIFCLRPRRSWRRASAG